MIRPVSNRNQWMIHTRIKGRGLNLESNFCIFFGSEFSSKISEFVVFSREDTVHKPSMALYAVEFNSEIEVQKWYNHPLYSGNDYRAFSLFIRRQEEEWTMNLLPSGGGGGASLCSSDRCALKFTHPIPPLFSNRRPGRCNCNPTQRPQTQPKLPSLAAANPGASRPSATVTPPSSTLGSHVNVAGDDVISLITQDKVPPEGVIQFQNPNSSSRIGKWR